MDQIIDGIQQLVNFSYDGVYGFFYEIFVEISTWFVIWQIEAKIFFLKFAWDVAQNLLANIGISSMIESSWSAIDSTTMSYITFFRLPEAFNILIQAGITKFTLRALSL